MTMLERWLTFALGLAIGGALVWALDYNAYFPIINELVQKCGEPCL